MDLVDFGSLTATGTSPEANLTLSGNVLLWDDTERRRKWGGVRILCQYEWDRVCGPA